MAKPGHRPVSNTDSSELAVFNEILGPGLTSVPSLPSYRSPQRSFGMELESARPESDQEQFPDVALASFGDATIFEVVIGQDDRVQVPVERMATNPFRQICALRIRSKSGKTYVGTAWFIGPRTLATAGHCVFLQNDGGWAESIRVIPAKFGASEPLGVLTSKQFGSVDGWVEQRSRDFDYGVIHLDDPVVGTRVGNFEVRVLDASTLKGTDAQVSGYPADRDAATFQYFHMRPLQDVTESRLIYDIDTFGGQSGSPIWQNTVELGTIAVGIHTSGAVTNNSGTRIGDDVLENFIHWTEE